MNKVEINFINMTDTVISGFNSATGLWENKKPITAAINFIKGWRAEIAGLVSEQAAATTIGTTDTLISELDNMVDLTIDIVQRLRPFAIATDNKTLLAGIDLSKSDIDHGKQMDAINICKVVLQEGVKYQPQMTEYELTEDMLEALTSAINGMAMLSGNRDAIIGTRKTATEGIPVLINKLRVRLEMLDDLVPALIDDEKFVQTFKNNRRIINR